MVFFQLYHIVADTFSSSEPKSELKLESLKRAYMYGINECEQLRDIVKFFCNNKKKLWTRWYLIDDFW